jgi:hypothetical protein
MAASSESRAFQHRLCGFGLFLVVLAAIGLAGLAVAKRRIAQTAQWPSVRGRIVTSEVTTTAVKTGRVFRESLVANTVYSYSVNGRNFRGDARRVVPMLHFETEGTPEEIVGKYPVGKSVTVYYDPNNPADALLTPVPAEDARTLIDALMLIAPMVGGVGLLVAGMAGLQLWRMRPMFRAIVPPVVQPALPALVITPRPVIEPRPPAPPRRTHWIVRGVATILGLGLFLFGSLVALTTLRMNSPQVSGNMRIVMVVLFGGMTLFGAFLVWVGMRRPRNTIQAA